MSEMASMETVPQAIEAKEIPRTEARAVWQEVVATSSYATFFHTPSWADVLTASFPRWFPSPLVKGLPSGNMVVVPRMERRLLGCVRWYSESMPPGVYGGPLFLRYPSEQDWESTWDVVKGLKNFVLIGNPYLPFEGRPPGAAIPGYTHALNLAGVRRGFSRGHRADINSAKRAGVEVAFSESASDVDVYYDAYQDCLLRWGERAGGFYPKRLFQVLFERSACDDGVKFLIARREGKLIAGLWIFFHNKHMVAWHDAVFLDCMKYYPIHLLMCKAIELAREAGAQWFDFNPSGGHQGVEHFKNGFRAEKLSFASYRQINLFGRTFRFMKYIKERRFRTCGLQ